MTAAGRVVAAIDIGTNSVKCLVARVNAGAIREVRLDTLQTTRLGERLAETKRLGELPMTRTATAVSEFVKQAVRLGAEQTRISGTSGVREAANGPEFIGRIHDSCNLELDILSGEEEARLSFLGATGGNGGRALVLDIGGGSTEWALGEGDRIELRRSYPAGALRFTEAFLTSDPPTALEMADALDAALAIFPDAPSAAGAPIIAIGGTARAIAMVALRGQGDAEGFLLTSQEVARQIRMYAASSIGQRSGIPGLDPDRSQIVLGGAIILDVCLRMAGAVETRCTLRGLRHGVVLDLAREA